VRFRTPAAPARAYLSRVGVAHDATDQRIERQSRLDVANRRNTMSTNRKLAVIATLATLVAAPAFAMDQDTAAVTINSGRYLPALNLSGARAHVRAPAGPFASAQPGHVRIDRVPMNAPIGGRDFQLQGRGLGE
jgi:hypothetical protein